MKTTTLAVLLANAAATFRQRDSAQFFGRRVDCGAVKTAATILTMYLALFFGGGVFISAYENLPLSSCLYEASSTVGQENRQCKATAGKNHDWIRKGASIP